MSRTPGAASGPYPTIGAVRRANKARGHHFFSEGAMAFFNSRVETDVVGGRFFVTSEAFDETSPRRYTVREAQPDGAVATFGEFRQHETIEAALAAIEVAR